MPIYEYECQACGRRFEIIQKVSEEPKHDCPYCGIHNRLKKLLSPPAIQFKGSGWYVTDYGKGRLKTPDKHVENKVESKVSADADKKESKQA